MHILAVNVPGKVPAAVGYTPFIMAVETLLATHRRSTPNICHATWCLRLALQSPLCPVHERLAIAAATTPPMPYRLLKLAEARW